MSLHLIVGLGNPGADYAATRHNAGYMLVERLAQRWGAGWKPAGRFKARLARATVGGRRVLLCQPQTYMNASGQAVRALVDYYGVPLERLLIAVDDADLPLGEIRLRSRGSSGGHHGLESVEQQLGTREYPRLRVGIGRRAGAREITGHVLSRFTDEEMVIMNKVLGVACDQVECWLDAGIQKAMSKFNGAVGDPERTREVK